MSCGRARTHDHQIGSQAPYPILPHRFIDMQSVTAYHLLCETFIYIFLFSFPVLWHRTRSVSHLSINPFSSCLAAITNRGECKYNKNITSNPDARCWDEYHKTFTALILTRIVWPLFHNLHIYLQSAPFILITSVIYLFSWATS